MQNQTGGDRPHYKTEGELQAAVEEYFALCQPQAASGEEGESRPERPCTLAGLASHLGFASRQALLDYAAAREGAVRNALLKIETSIEEKLLSGRGGTGAALWLKNHAGYRDRAEITHSGGAGLQVSIIDRYEVAE